MELSLILVCLLINKVIKNTWTKWMALCSAGIVNGIFLWEGGGMTDGLFFLFCFESSEFLWALAKALFFSPQQIHKSPCLVQEF